MLAKLLSDPGFERLRKLDYEWNQAHLSNWLNDDLHKWTWWLNLAAIVVPIIILWKVIDRRRLLEILVFGAIVAMLATFLDALGIAFMLWDYPDRFLHISPRLFPVNFVALPFLYMVIYQSFVKWKSYIAANIVLSLILSFVVEPTLIWLNLYEPIQWQHIYSFPIYIIIAVLVKWITGLLAARDLNYRNGLFRVGSRR